MVTKKNNKVLTADELIGGGATGRREKIDLTEELGGVVYIRPVKAGEVLQFIKATRNEQGEMDQVKQAEAMPGVIANVIVTAEGDKIFDDPEAIQDLDFDVYTKISTAVVARFNPGGGEGGEEGNDFSDIPPTEDSSALPTV